RGHLEAGEVERAADLAMQLKAQLETLRRQGEEAEAALRRLRDVLADAEAMNTPLPRTSGLLEKAERAYRMGQFDEALDIVAQADLVSDSRKAFALGDYVKALDTAIHASDSIADLRVLLDEVAEVRDKAKALLETAVDVGADASKFEKAFQDGESAFELGEVERARAAFAGSIEWGRSLIASYLRDHLTRAEALL